MYTVWLIWLVLVMAYFAYAYGIRKGISFIFGILPPKGANEVYNTLDDDSFTSPLLDGDGINQVPIQKIKSSPASKQLVNAESSFVGSCNGLNTNCWQDHHLNLMICLVSRILVTYRPDMGSVITRSVMNTTSYELRAIQTSTSLKLSFIHLDRMHGNEFEISLILCVVLNHKSTGYFVMGLFIRLRCPNQVGHLLPPK